MHYKAFISYSHAADGKLAPSIQSALQRFAKPWYRMRAFLIFRDTTNLSSTPELWPVIETALSDSEYLLFMASPEAARSKWVRKEQAYWREKKDTSKLLIVLTAGEIVWDDAAGDFDWSRTTAVPDVLQGAFRNEPLYLDFRPMRAGQLSISDRDFLDNIATIAAPLHGKSKDEIFGEHIRQHRRTMRIASFAATIVALLLMVATWFWRDAVAQRAEASQNRAKNALEMGSGAARAQSYDRAVPHFHVATTDEGYRTVATRLVDAWSGYCGMPLVQDYDAAPIVPNNPYVSFGASQYQRLDDEAPIAVSPDGQRIVAGSGPKAQVWQLPSGAPVGVPIEYKSMIKAVAFAEGGTVLCLGEGHVEGDQPRLGIERSDVWTKFIHPGQIGNACFSPDNARLLTIPLTGAGMQADQDLTCRLWDIPSGRHVRALPHDGVVTAYAFTDDAERLVTTDGVAAVWDVTTGNLVRKLTDGESGETRAIDTRVNSVAWCRQNQCVLCGCQDGSIRLWNVSDGTFKTIGVHVRRDPQAPPDAPPTTISIVAVGPHETLFVSVAANTVSIWNFTSAAETCHFVHDASISAVAFHPSGKVLACGTTDRKVWLWDVEKAENEWVRGYRTEPIISRLTEDNAVTRVRYLSKAPKIDHLQFIPSTHQLVVVCGDTPRLHDLQSFLPVVEYVNPDEQTYDSDVTAVAWSHDGSYCALGRENGGAELWDATNAMKPSLKHLLPPTSPGERVESIAFGRNSAEVAIGRSASRMVDLYDEESGSRIGELEHDDGWAIAIAFALNDEEILTCTNSTSHVHWWIFNRSKKWLHPVKLDTGLSMFNDPVAVFSVEGGVLAIGTNGEADVQSNEVKLWDISSHEQQRSILVSDAITCLAFSGDGSRLAIGTAAGSTQVWELNGVTRRLVAEVGQQGRVNAVALDATGETLVTCGHSWQLWDVATNHPLGAPLAFSWRTQAVAFNPNEPSLLFGCSDPDARLWSIPERSNDDPERLALSVEVRTTLRRDANGNLIRLNAKEWRERRTELDRLDASASK